MVKEDGAVKLERITTAWTAVILIGLLLWANNTPRFSGGSEAIVLEGYGFPAIANGPIQWQMACALAIAIEVGLLWETMRRGRISTVGFIPLRRFGVSSGSIPSLVRKQEQRVFRFMGHPEDHTNSLPERRIGLCWRATRAPTAGARPGRGSVPRLVSYRDGPRSDKLRGRRPRAFRLPATTHWGYPLETPKHHF